jgi:N-acetyl-gamma-glutamyl-phosphate reductase
MGGSGYTGGELLRLLLNHPHADIIFVHSRNHAGSLIASVHTDLLGDTSLEFTATVSQDIDLVFLCLGHGESQKIISTFGPHVKIIDLSQDFRSASDGLHSFVYGLPEMNREKIRQATHIANPGCFATAIQLALLPLAEKELLRSDINVSCTTGSTGAGLALAETSHFSWRQNNLSVYKPFVHQHLTEISKSIKQLQPGFNHSVFMFPQRGSFTRGILACLNLSVKENIEDLWDLYAAYYHKHPFVQLSKTSVDLKQVVNTNKCFLYLEKQNEQLMVVSIIDNLLKGASGQAVQNMNLLSGFDEKTGLHLKASAF